MISFGIMTALLVALACLVHYDLLGLFLAHPYGRRIVYTDNERHQSQPRSEYDYMWIPRPGTDPNTLNLFPRPITVQYHGSDGEDYWTDWDDDVSSVNTNNGTTGRRLSDGKVHRWEPAPDTVVDHGTTVDHVPTTKTTEEPDDSDDDDDDYVAPGQEWDDDVF